MHHLMRLWYFSSSVNSFFKRACAAIQWGLDIWFLVAHFVYFHTSCVRTAKALARDCLDRAFAGRLCDKYHNLMSWLKWGGGTGGYDSSFSLPLLPPLLSSFSFRLFSLPLLPLHSSFLLCLPSPMSHLPPPFKSVHVAERLALPTSYHGVAGSNPAGGEILPEPKQRFIAQSLSYSPFHHLEMTDILCWRDVKP